MRGATRAPTTIVSSSRDRESEREPRRGAAAPHREHDARGHRASPRARSAPRARAPRSRGRACRAATCRRAESSVCARRRAACARTGRASGPLAVITLAQSSRARAATIARRRIHLVRPSHRARAAAECAHVGRGGEHVRRSFAARREHDVAGREPAEQELERAHLVAAERRRGEIVALDPELAREQRRRRTRRAARAWGSCRAR